MGAIPYLNLAGSVSEILVSTDQIQDSIYLHGVVGAVWE